MSARYRRLGSHCTPLLLALLAAWTTPVSLAVDDIFFAAANAQGNFRPSTLLFLRPDAQRLNRSAVYTFQARDPSPTAATIQSFGVSQVRFIESNAGAAPRTPTDAGSARREKSTGTPNRFVPLPIITAVPSDDRWPWPSNNVGIARPATIESAADALQGAATTVARAVDKPAQSRPAPVASTGGVSSPLIIKKSVPKPYRILSHVSSCPKLFHDLSLSCQMTQQQQQGQPLWRKTVYNQNLGDAGAKDRRVLEPVRLPIAQGNHLQTKNVRYAVATTFDSTTLTIRQLKVDDCGSYTCEAAFANGTVVTSSDLLIFLCF